MQIKTKILVEGTLMAALAMVFSLIPLQVGSSFSISLGQIPLTIFALRRGVKPGLLAGLVWGLLHFPLGQVYFLSVPQVLIEYSLAFMFAGFAGVFMGSLMQAIHNEDVKKATFIVIKGALAGSLARYFWHFVAGWIFWGQYALWGLAPSIFSLVMNGASGLATGGVTALALVLLYRAVPRLFKVEDSAALKFNS